MTDCHITEEFSAVTVVKKANVYFNGGVVSRTVRFADGAIKTLGFMQPGNYQFDTQQKELMEIQSGKVEVLLAPNGDWQHFGPGDSFTVAANSRFLITATEPTDYCCSFS